MVAQVKASFHLSLSLDYAERMLAARPALSADDLYRKALMENLKDVCDRSSLPLGIASEVSVTLLNTVVLQINSSRDATQPLRPCADTTEEETAMNSALQKFSCRRLLRLVLTDGFVEVPAFELSTLSSFKGIPIPGEKLLIKAGADVRSGAIIMTESNTLLLGGEVTQLRQEFMAHRRRLESGFQTVGAINGAPQFAPLELGQRYVQGDFGRTGACRDRGTFQGVGRRDRGSPPASRGAFPNPDGSSSRGGGPGGGARGRGRGSGGPEGYRGEHSRGARGGRGYRGSAGTRGGYVNDDRGRGSSDYQPRAHVDIGAVAIRIPVFDEHNYPVLE